MKSKVVVAAMTCVTVVCVAGFLSEVRLALVDVVPNPVPADTPTQPPPAIVAVHEPVGFIAKNARIQDGFKVYNLHWGEMFGEGAAFGNLRNDSRQKADPEVHVSFLDSKGVVIGSNYCLMLSLMPGEVWNWSVDDAPDSAASFEVTAAFN